MIAIDDSSLDHYRGFENYLKHSQREGERERERD
jgi:hypothetical protein